MILIAFLCCSFGVLHWSQSSIFAASPWFILAIISSLCVGVWHAVNPDDKMVLDQYVMRIEIMLVVPFVLVLIIVAVLSCIPSEVSTSGKMLNGIQAGSLIVGTVIGWFLAAASFASGAWFIKTLTPKLKEGV